MKLKKSGPTRIEPDRVGFFFTRLAICCQVVIISTSSFQQEKTWS